MKRSVAAVAVVLLAACGGGKDDGGSPATTGAAASYELSGEQCEQAGVRTGIPGDATYSAHLRNTAARSMTFVVTVDFIRAGDNARVASQSQTVDALGPGQVAAIKIPAQWENDGRWDAQGSRLSCHLRGVTSR